MGIVTSMAKASAKLKKGMFGWSKPAAKPKKASTRPAIKKTAPARDDSPVAQARKRYQGPAPLVAAELLWGKNRLWLEDEAGEAALHWQAAKSENIGVLGAGLGGRANRIAAQVPTASVFEFDWRADVLQWRNAKSKQDAGQESRICYEVNIGMALPPPKRCMCMIGAEPLFAQTGTKLLRWARTALEAGGVLVLEELVNDSVTPPTKERCTSWLSRDTGHGQWLRLEEQSNVLRRHGLVIGKVKERTGAHLRALKMALESSAAEKEALDQAIKLAPELKSVADHFSCEQKAAKNRLKALEHGALAVYRIEVIKPRADELI